MSTSNWQTTTKRTARKDRKHTPAPAPTNAKTVLCKFYKKNGQCPFGGNCNYAHGMEELTKHTPRKMDTPCWYYNTAAGCSKSDAECVYQHVKVENMRKPLHLQHPCPFFHHRTPRKCRRGDGCGGDHFYELSAEEWQHHFPQVQYPGSGYLQEPSVPTSAPTSALTKQTPITEDFPVLQEQNAPKPVTGGAWGKPLAFKPDEVSQPEPTTEDFPRLVLSRRVRGVPVTQVTPEPKQSPRQYKPYAGEWGDCDDDDDDDDDDFFQRDPNEVFGVLDSRRPTASTLNVPPPPPPTANPVDLGAETRQFLMQNIGQLEEQITQMAQQTLGADTDSTKMPAVDGELRTLVSTVLKQLLNA